MNFRSKRAPTIDQLESLHWLIYSLQKESIEFGQAEPPERSPAHYLWAVLIARIYEVFPLLCSMCGGQMRLIALITQSADIRKIFDHIGMQSEPHAILSLAQLNFLSVPAVRQGAHIAIYGEGLVRLLEVFLPMQQHN